MAHDYRTTIFGQDLSLNRLGRTADYAFAANVYLNTGLEWSGQEPRPFNWAQVPDDFTVAGGSIAYCVYLMYRDTVLRRFENPEDLRQYGWQQLNPNAAAIAEIESNLDVYRERFRRAENGEGGFRVHTFQADPQNRRGRLNCVLPKLLDGFRVVYLPRQIGRVYATMKPGIPYACKFSCMRIEHLPTIERPGFQLIEVFVEHEHFDPDAKIVRLREQIAAGNP